MNHSLSCPLSGVAGGNDGRLCVPHSFTKDSNDIGIECVQTHNEQTSYYPFSVVAFRENILGLKPRRVATDLKKWYRLHRCRRQVEA
jgi:hypothetical protein